MNRYGKVYISLTQSRFNRQDYVEEHREKVIGADGETRYGTRRRLGDCWYEKEVEVDKEGKKTERETWHNVSDDDIEKFKEEWSSKHVSKTPIEGSKVEAEKPIEDSVKAEGTEESKKD
jgi:hypothetical protein